MAESIKNKEQADMAIPEFMAFCRSLILLLELGKVEETKEMLLKILE